MPNLNLNPGRAASAVWTTGDGANPTAGETITVDGVVFEWDGVGANINVTIGGDINESIGNLAGAIQDEIDAGDIDPNLAPMLGGGFLIMMMVQGGFAGLMGGNMPDPNMDLPTVSASQILDLWASDPAVHGGGQWASFITGVTPAHVSQGTMIVIAPFYVRHAFVTCYRNSIAVPTSNQVQPDGSMVLSVKIGGAQPSQAGDLLNFIVFESVPTP